MSETATEKTYTAEEIKAMWDALPEQIQQAITATNEKVDAHNRNIALIKAASGDEAKQLLFELRDQNPNGDEKLKKYNDEITRLNKRIEDLIKQASDRAAEVYAENLKTPTEEELKAARESVAKSGTELRAAIKGTSEFAKLMGVPLDVHFKSIETLRGSGGTRKSPTGDIWRPRLTDIFVNGEPIKAKVKNAQGVEEERSTFNILNSFLNKKVGSKEFSVVDLQQAYLTAGGGDKDNLPETVEFDLPFKKGDAEINFRIKVVK